MVMPTDYEKVLLTKTDSQDDMCKAGLPSPDWQKVARVLAEECAGNLPCLEATVDGWVCPDSSKCPDCWLSWAVREVERDH